MTIKELRKSTGMSQRDFCELFDIPKRTLQGWEQGMRKPPQYIENMVRVLIDTVGVEQIGALMQDRNCKKGQENESDFAISEKEREEKEEMIK